MSEIVVKVQLRLKELGLYSGNVDGICGDKTAAAVRQFQSTIKGLVVDGIPGPATQAALLTWTPIPSRDVDPKRAEPPAARPVWPRQPDVERMFGEPGEHQVMLNLPFEMVLDWETETPIKRFSVHEKVHDSALRCFQRVADAYDANARRRIGLDRFGGCLAVRAMRGGSRLSMHSWGIAIDFDPSHNELRWDHTRARLAKPDCETFWRIWEDEGWVSLGRARDFDHMHLQAARL
jgi:hypothetical protein